MQSFTHPELLRPRLPGHRTIATALLLAGVLFTAGPIGCAGFLQQPAPGKTIFDIEPGTPGNSSEAAPTTTAAAEAALQVRPVRVRPPYDGTNFVYKTAASQLTLDYYNNFVAAPSALLTGGLVDWLERDLPRVAAGASVQSDLVLECDVTKLLVDFSDPAKPRAVIAARFFLLANRSGGTVVISDTGYEVSVPLASNNPGAYAAAWGRAYRQILQEVAVVIHGALSRPSTRGAARE